MAWLSISCFKHLKNPRLVPNLPIEGLLPRLLITIFCHRSVMLSSSPMNGSPSPHLTTGLVIPTFNEEQALPRTFLYLRQCAFDEIVIVDGGSQDHTLQVVESYVRNSGTSSTKLLSSPRGRARQMNTGAAALQTDIMVFLHADTLLPRTSLAAIAQAMENQRCVGGRFDIQFEEDRGYAWVISRMMNWRSRLTGIATGDQVVFVRKSVFDQMGGFADIPIMEDIEFTKRLKRQGDIAAILIKVTTSFRRWEQHGPLRTILSMWALRVLYWLGLSPHTLSHFYKPTR